MLIEGNQRSEGCRPQASMASKAYSSRPKMGIYIVGAEGELNAAVLGPTDDFETGDEVGESHKKPTQAELD